MDKDNIDMGFSSDSSEDVALSTLAKIKTQKTHPKALVYTTRLEDMTVLKGKSLKRIKVKRKLLSSIIGESKPTYNKADSLFIKKNKLLYNLLCSYNQKSNSQSYTNYDITIKGDQTNLEKEKIKQEIYTKESFQDSAISVKGVKRVLNDSPSDPDDIAKKKACELYNDELNINNIVASKFKSYFEYMTQNEAIKDENHKSTTKDDEENFNEISDLSKTIDDIITAAMCRRPSIDLGINVKTETTEKQNIEPSPQIAQLSLLPSPPSPLQPLLPPNLKIPIKPADEDIITIDDDMGICISDPRSLAPKPPLVPRPYCQRKAIITMFNKKKNISRRFWIGPRGRFYKKLEGQAYTVTQTGRLVESVSTRYNAYQDCVPNFNTPSWAAGDKTDNVMVKRFEYCCFHSKVKCLSELVPLKIRLTQKTFDEMKGQHDCPPYNCTCCCPAGNVTTEKLVVSQKIKDPNNVEKKIAPVVLKPSKSNAIGIVVKEYKETDTPKIQQQQKEQKQKQLAVRAVSRDNIDKKIRYPFTMLSQMERRRGPNIIFTYPMNVLMDVYAINEFGFLFSHLTISSNTNHAKTVLSDKNSRIFLICCWTQRHNTVCFLEKEFKVGLSYLRNRHACLTNQQLKFGSCECCCYKDCITKIQKKKKKKNNVKPAVNSRILDKQDTKKKNNTNKNNKPIIHETFKRHERESTPERKVTTDCIVPVVDQSLLIDTNRVDQLNQIIPDANEMDDDPLSSTLNSKSPQVEDIVSKILKRFNGIQLTLNNGKVGLLINEHISTFSPLEINILTQILNYSQQHVNSLDFSKSIDVNSINNRMKKTPDAPNIEDRPVTESSVAQENIVSSDPTISESKSDHNISILPTTDDPDEKLVLLPQDPDYSDAISLDPVLDKSNKAEVQNDEGGNECILGI